MIGIHALRLQSIIGTNRPTDRPTDQSISPSVRQTVKSVNKPSEFRILVLNNYTQLKNNKPSLVTTIK